MDEKLKGLGLNSAVEFNDKLLGSDAEAKHIMGLLNRRSGPTSGEKVEKEITIVNRLGLHARPAAMFVRCRQPAPL